MSVSGNHHEQRSAPRIKALFLVSFVNKQDGVQQFPISLGQTIDISKGGVKLVVAQEIQVGSEMEMHLAMGEQLVPVRGKVVHSSRNGDGKCLLGIQFDRPIK